MGRGFKRRFSGQAALFLGGYEIADLKAQLRKEFEPDKIAELKKLIREKETYYNILADRRRTGI